MKKKLIAILASVVVVLATIYFIATGKKSKEIKSALNNPEFDDIDKAAALLKPIATVSFFNSLVKGVAVSSKIKKADAWVIAKVDLATYEGKQTAYNLTFFQNVESKVYDLDAINGFRKYYDGANYGISNYEVYKEADLRYYIAKILSLGEPHYKKGVGVEFLKNSLDFDVWDEKIDYQSDDDFSNKSWIFAIKLENIKIDKFDKGVNTHLKFLQNYNLYNNQNKDSLYYGNVGFEKAKANGMILANSEKPFKILISKSTLTKIKKNLALTLTVPTRVISL